MLASIQQVSRSSSSWTQAQKVWNGPQDGLTWDLASGDAHSNHHGLEFIPQPYALEWWFRGSVSDVQWHPAGLLLWWDLSSASHCSAFSGYRPFPEPGSSISSELADIFPMHLFFAVVNQTRFLFFMRMLSNMTVPHRTDIALPRSRDSVYMDQGSLNWVNVHLKNCSFILFIWLRGC